MSWGDERTSKRTAALVILGAAAAAIVVGICVSPRFASVIEGVPQGRQWQTVSARRASYEIKLSRWDAVMAYAPGRMPKRVRAVLDGRFVSSDPSVYAVLLSPSDYKLAASGYPPLDPSPTYRSGEDFEVRLPPGYSYFFIFRVPAKTDFSRASSLTGALMMALQSAAASATPARVSLESNVELQYFGTPEEAARQIKAIRRAEGR